MSAVLTVPFRGPGAGVGELSWGQREIWAAMVAQESSLSAGAVAPMPEGADIDYVASMLGYLMGRYPTFRTRLRFEPDGTVRQVLFDHGEIPLHIVDLPDDSDVEAEAEKLRVEYVNRVFDYEHEWPIRMAVLRHHGVPTHMVAVHCHLAMDGGGFQVVAAALASYDEHGGPEAIPDDESVQNPLDQARWQHGPSGERHHAMVERHWRKQLGKIPVRRFARTYDEQEPRYWRVTGNSPAARVAMRAIAARAGLPDTSPVLMAAVAVALAHVTGISPAVLQVVVNNRFRPGLATTAGPVAQSALCAIDVAGVTFDESVDRARRSLMSAYLNAYYDPARMAEAIAAVGQERGEAVDLDCFYNDRRDSGREYTGPAPTPDELCAAARMSVTWGPHQTTPTPRFYVHVLDVPDAIELLVFADTQYLPPDHLTGLFNRFEEVLVNAAFDPAAPTEISALVPDVPPLGEPVAGLPDR